MISLYKRYYKQELFIFVEIIIENNDDKPG